MADAAGGASSDLLHQLTQDHKEKLEKCKLDDMRYDAYERLAARAIKFHNKTRDKLKDKGFDETKMQLHIDQEIAYENRQYTVAKMEAAYERKEVTRYQLRRAEITLEKGKADWLATDQLKMDNEEGRLRYRQLEKQLRMSAGRSKALPWASPLQTLLDKIAPKPEAYPWRAGPPMANSFNDPQAVPSVHQPGPGLGSNQRSQYDSHNCGPGQFSEQNSQAQPTPNQASEAEPPRNKYEPRSSQDSEPEQDSQPRHVPKRKPVPEQPPEERRGPAPMPVPEQARGPTAIPEPAPMPGPAPKPRSTPMLEPEAMEGENAATARGQSFMQDPRWSPRFGSDPKPKRRWWMGPKQKPHVNSRSYRPHERYTNQRCDQYPFFSGGGRPPGSGHNSHPGHHQTSGQQPGSRHNPGFGQYANSEQYSNSGHHPSWGQHPTSGHYSNSEQHPNSKQDPRAQGDSRQAPLQPPPSPPPQPPLGPPPGWSRPPKEALDPQDASNEASHQRRPAGSGLGQGPEQRWQPEGDPGSAHNPEREETSMPDRGRVPKSRKKTLPPRDTRSTIIPMPKDIELYFDHVDLRLSEIPDLKNFPEPLAWACGNGMCVWGRANRFMDACECNITTLFEYRCQHLFRGDLKKNLKKEMARWHEDKFSGCDVNLRSDFQHKARQIFSVVSDLLEEEKDRQDRQQDRPQTKQKSQHQDRGQNRPESQRKGHGQDPPQNSPPNPPPNPPHSQPQSQGQGPKPDTYADYKAGMSKRTTRANGQHRGPDPYYGRDHLRDDYQP